MDRPENNDDIQRRLSAALADLRENEVLALVRWRMARGDDPLRIIEDCQAGMREVGERYTQQRYFLSGLIMAGEILREVMEIVMPSVEERFSGKSAGRVLLGTVQGDIHDLGKNLLVMLLRPTVSTCLIWASMSRPRSSWRRHACLSPTSSACPA